MTAEKMDHIAAWLNSEGGLGFRLGLCCGFGVMLFVVSLMTWNHITANHRNRAAVISCAYVGAVWTQNNETLVGDARSGIRDAFRSCWHTWNFGYDDRWYSLP